MGNVSNKILLKSVEKSIPFNVIFELTYKCNEDCIHCYRVLEKRPELSTEDIYNILEQLAAAGCLNLTFTGGEIFTRIDILDILEYASKQRFSIKLFTNGTLITEQIADNICKLSVHEVHISVYSADAGTHDSITRISGSFVKSIHAIKMFKNRGIKVKLKCPLMKQNVKDYRAVLKMANDLGIICKIDPTITAMSDGSKSTHSLRINKKDELIQIYSDPKLNPYVDYDFDSSPNISDGILPDIPCVAGHNLCAISPYGDVSPCIQVSVIAGNLRKDTFANIWYNSEKMQQIRSIRESDIVKCNMCKWRSSCGRCPGLALLEDGDILGPSSRACQIAPIHRQIAGRR